MCDLGYDFDAAPFVSTSHPVARREHTCVCCHGKISVGEMYYRVAHKWEGEFGSDKCCVQCEQDIDQFGDAHDGYPFPSSFMDFLVDCISEGDEESDKKWSPMLERIKARGSSNGVTYRERPAFEPPR